MGDDNIAGFRLGVSVDILGSLVGRSNLAVTYGENKATLSAGGNSLELNGTFGGGDFIAAAHGTGADAHTTITYASFLPALQEGVRVDPSDINGVLSEAFLQGDGTVQFTLQFESAVSLFSNTFGYYEVAANGTLGNVFVLFANTLNVAPGARTLDLAVPAAGATLGFFVIQDGFDFYGGLANDLSFRAPGTTTAATLDAGLPPLIFSDSRGALDSAAIFHSFSTLNPGDAVQTLSGTSAGGLDMWLGFEDLPIASGDNDFQDIVISIRTNADGLLVV